MSQGIKIMKVNNIINNKKAGWSITGTVFIALSLITIFGLVTGISFNEIKEGLGNLPLGFATIAFIVLLIIAIVIGLKH
jgi:hypothetical protein